MTISYIAPSRAELGYSKDLSDAALLECRKSYRQGFDAFLLGKSVTSGRQIFDRGAFAIGWRVAAVYSCYRIDIANGRGGRPAAVI